MLRSGAFREDLYYRLSVFEIELPPLRERIQDLEILIQTILERISMPKVRFSEEALECLRGYRFPGNIRELRNIVERAVILADDGTVHPAHLPSQVRAPAGALSGSSAEVVSLEEAERRYLSHALAAHHGERKELAAKLGISERALYRKLAALRGD